MKNSIALVNFTQFQTWGVYFQIYEGNFGYFCHLLPGFSVKFAHQNFTDVCYIWGHCGRYKLWKLEIPHMVFWFVLWESLGLISILLNFQLTPKMDSLYVYMPFNYPWSLLVIVWLHLVPTNITGIRGNQTVHEGDNLQLTCKALGRPEPNITWTKEKPGNQGNTVVV